MKHATFFLLVAIIVSCSKDISNQLIQPVNSNRKTTKQIFPFTKYTTVKSYSFNKYPPPQIDLQLKKELDSLRKVDTYEAYLLKDDDTINLRKHHRRTFELEQLFKKPEYPSILVDGQLLPQANYKKTLTENDLIQLGAIFHQPSKLKQPIPSTTCATYRDALIFYNKNDEIIGTIEFCFQCQKVRFSTTTYRQVKHFQNDKWEQFELFFRTLGHRFDYHKNDNNVN